MYQPIELARFTQAEFQRGLEGLTDEEARTRMRKADGSEMNAISWTVGHIAGHWLLVASAGGDEEPDRALLRYFGQKADSTPLLLTVALRLLEEAEASIDWLLSADESLLSSTPDDLRRESVGTRVMRVVLHTWFHIGEINAVRQILGHDEIGFVGDITGHLEWRGGGGVDTGYRPDDLARFAISEFARGLEGLTAEEAQSRIAKTGGGEMNAITWIVSHIVGHWLSVAAYAKDGELPWHLVRFVGEAADPTPPALQEALKLLRDAKASIDWLTDADETLLSTTREEHLLSKQGQDNIGTVLINAVLHTWFHTGEINAIRQMLGHAEIPFVGEMLGKLEWQGVPT